MAKKQDNLPDPQQDDQPVRPARRSDTKQAKQTRDFVLEAARQLEDLHCTDVVIFDVRGISDLTDYILLASGTSDRQIRSVSREMATLAKNYDLERFGQDADGDANWIVTDFVEVVLHLFEPATRAHYDLEMMWGDAPRLEYKRSSRK